MSSVIEDTVKALVDFESELDKAKSEASEAKKKILKDAADWAESAGSNARSKAQQLAAERLEKARSEAEKEADAIKEKGESSLKTFEAAISKRKAKASEQVVARLLGESS